MKISYNWLKWYVPDVPEAKELADIFTYHICEVESVEKKPDGDIIFDLNILPNRAHDLLSHQGIARELASLLNIKFIDPTPKYKILKSKPTELKIKIESDNCRRYMGRIIRGVKVVSSPEWVVKHLESIGERSVNNMVDAANIVMYDSGQPTHVFDLNKTKNKLIIRQAKTGEGMTTLDNKMCRFKSSDLVISDTENVLAVAGVKGGKLAQVGMDTTDIILEVANFNPTSVRKTAQALNIFTDARKRFENDLSPTLAPFAMTELSALIGEMCPEAVFEDIVDVYPNKQEEKKFSFSAERISSILGVHIKTDDIKDILNRYNFEHKKSAGVFEIVVPMMRLDLTTEEDMAEEIGRVLGYERVQPKFPKISFKPKVNETYTKISQARNKLLGDGYSEVMTYAFRDKGEVEVEKSASDKKFLRTNLADGLKESIKLNQVNALLLGTDEIKVFEIGTVWVPEEEMHVAYGNKKEIKEMTLEEFTSQEEKNFVALAGSGSGHEQNFSLLASFKMWSLFPFIARDIAVWVPEGVKSENVFKIIKENMGDMVVRGPELFDEFKKDNKTSYAFRIIFQSFERTLTDKEVNEIMDKISDKIKEKGWEVR